MMDGAPNNSAPQAGLKSENQFTHEHEATITETAQLKVFSARETYTCNILKLLPFYFVSVT